MSLLLTEDVQRSHRAKTGAEKHLEETVKYIREETEQSILLDDGDLMGFGDMERRLGKPMFSGDLEAKLKPLLPSNVIFVDNPFVTSKKAIQRVKGGVPETICVYERGYMPERSIMKIETATTPDPDFLATREKMHRADLPKWEYRNGDIVFDERDARPGFRRIVKMGGEKIRGWRTVLLRLLQAGYLTIAQIERNFGAANTAAWAGHTGKRDIKLAL